MRSQIWTEIFMRYYSKEQGRKLRLELHRFLTGRGLPTRICLVANATWEIVRLSTDRRYCNHSALVNWSREIVRRRPSFSWRLATPLPAGPDHVRVGIARNIVRLCWIVDKAATHEVIRGGYLRRDVMASYSKIGTCECVADYWCQQEDSYDNNCY